MRSRFTRWYFRKGYRAAWNLHAGSFEYRCPLWVKPLLFLFSPSVYMHEQFDDSLQAIERAAEAEDECESPIEPVGYNADGTISEEEWKAIRRQIRREPFDKETFEKARSALLESDPELVEAMERDLQKSYESRWEAIHSTSYVGNVSPEELSKRIKEFGKHRKNEKAGE